MDSTTLLWWLKARQQDPIHAISIDYGQRHRVELECAARLARRAEVAAHETLALDLAALGGNPLTDPTLDVPAAESKRQRDTVVPFRNMLFATLAAAYCATKGIVDLYMAPVKDDYRGLPRLPSPLLRQPRTEPAFGGCRRRALGDPHSLCQTVEAGHRCRRAQTRRSLRGDPHLL